MRKLAGYLCHLASVRLHEAAVGLLEPIGVDANVCSQPIVVREVTCTGCGGDGIIRIGHDPEYCDCGMTGVQWDQVTLPDVAPRLAAAVEAIGDRVQHTKWLAGIVGLERMVKESDRGS